MSNENMLFTFFNSRFRLKGKGQREKERHKGRRSGARRIEDLPQGRHIRKRKNCIRDLQVKAIHIIMPGECNLILIVVLKIILDIILKIFCLKSISNHKMLLTIIRTF
jgi:hypothetical protein